MGCSSWGRKESGTTERLILTYLLRVTVDNRVSIRLTPLPSRSCESKTWGYFLAQGEITTESIHFIFTLGFFFIEITIHFT